MIIGYRLEVYGLVQGVGFRYMTQLAAQKLALDGWVANRPDGSVEIEASGTAKHMAQFVEAVKASPSPYGRVDRTVITRINPFTAGTGFKVH